MCRPRDDMADEENGGVTLTIETGTGYTLGDDDEATVAVEDNDIPMIVITDPVTTMKEGESDSFTVTASNLNTSSSYVIRLSTGARGLSFESDCSNTAGDSKDISVGPEVFTFSKTVTIYGCEPTSTTVSATTPVGWPPYRLCRPERHRDGT